MDRRWEALFGIVSVAILFVPVFTVVCAAVLSKDTFRKQRERRIAEYRKSPASRLLILNERS
jgi:hypothetical protein